MCVGVCAEWSNATTNPLKLPKKQKDIIHNTYNLKGVDNMSFKNSKVNILGSEYKIICCKVGEHKLLTGNYSGRTDISTKEIIIREKDDECDMQEYEVFQKHILRHELIHAFLFESGLDSSVTRICGPWTDNEEMIDWLAIQSPKIFKVFEELGIL